MQLKRLALLLLLLALACVRRDGYVDDARISGALVNEPGNWLAHGLDFREQRFSPLTQINKETVKDLGLAWRFDLKTKFGQEATPLVVDGMLIFPNQWNVVHALDAVTGEVLWTYDPEVDRARHGWMPISRGIAAYMGNVYVATGDGWLDAVDIKTGERVWRVDTISDRSLMYSITGAPRVGGGKVYIGNSGSERKLRGYTTAYDALTGKQVWRFWSVPGNPAKPFEHPEMRKAATTWDGDWWKYGGGGTVWNSIVYDEELNQVYLGTGNGAPYPRIIRSPKGGDNLFVASIIAVDAETGKMNWYYQEVPGDNWDFTATQDMALAEMEVDGRSRKVILQAPKNGFFYVIDRTNGQLLRAHPFARVNWATHIDLKSGRPVESGAASYDQEAKWVFPGGAGAHNWQAMSVDTGTGLVYLPTQDAAQLRKLDPRFGKVEKYEFVASSGMGMDPLIPDIRERPAYTIPEKQGYLLAFDPLTGGTRWKKKLDHYWNGGVLATAGGLVFQGGGDGHISAYAKESGEQLWDFDAYTSIMAPPITYQVQGKQFLALLTGGGGVENVLTGSGQSASLVYGNRAELLVFALGAQGTLEEPPRVEQLPPEQQSRVPKLGDLVQGSVKYHNHCSHCHGQRVLSAGNVPDLRFMSQSVRDSFVEIVLKGKYEERGMRRFDKWLTQEDTDQILDYVLHRARRDRAAIQAASGEAKEERNSSQQ